MVCRVRGAYGVGQAQPGAWRASVGNQEGSVNSGRACAGARGDWADSLRGETQSVQKRRPLRKRPQKQRRTLRRNQQPRNSKRTAKKSSVRSAKKAKRKSKKQGF